MIGRSFLSAGFRCGRAFQTTPWKWRNDILRFFRVGMLAGFLGNVIGIDYIEEQKHAERISYTNPSDLFLNGIIDTKRGSCANLAALHVAISRRMGWPVSLASAGTHWISRFDDGQVYHNIETSKATKGSFARRIRTIFTSRNLASQARQLNAAQTSGNSRHVKCLVRSSALAGVTTETSVGWIWLTSTTRSPDISFPSTGGPTSQP